MRWTDDMIQNKLNSFCDYYTGRGDECPGCPFAQGELCKYDGNDATNVAIVMEHEEGNWQ